MPHSARAGGLWTTQSSRGGVGGRRLRRLAVPFSDMAVSFRERAQGSCLRRTASLSSGTMAEQKDDINEERRILKKAGILDDKLLDRMDIYPGDRVRFRFYYPQSGFDEIVGHFLGFYTLYEGPEGGGDLNLVIRTAQGWRRRAEMGARSIPMSAVRTVNPFECRSRDPPHIMFHPNIRAMNEIAPARVAATDITRMSRFRTCETSWARTPRSSSSVRVWRMPCVTATTACCGLRPVANAFGVSVGTMATFGIGRFACCVT